MDVIPEVEERPTHTVYDGKLLHGEKSKKDKVVKFFKRKLQILQWLPDYKKSFVLADLIAGFTVWMTAIPASMGDASVSGLSPEYGLYSAYVGAIVYVFLGSCKELVIGPQAVLSLLSYQACGNDYPECVILLGFYTGCVHLLLGILHMGFLVSFISEPTAVGFTAGAAVLIATGQIKTFLGISGSSSGTNIIPIWRKIVADVETIRMGDAVLGVSSVVVLVILFKLKDIERLSRWKKPLHILSVCRNAIVMVISILLGYFLYNEDPEEAVIKVTGNVPNGFPAMQLPHFTLVHPKDRFLNSTEGLLDPNATRMDTLETLTFLGSSPFVIAFIGILQNVAIGKKFAHSGSGIDATQELIALGAINLVGSGYFQAIPTSASFSRSAVNASSGVKSHFAAFISGILMILSLAFLTPYFKYIPKASLGSIIIAAMIFMIDFQSIWRLWKFAKLDLFGGVVTFLSSILLGMEYGILIGVSISILVILLKSLRPSLRAEYRHHLKSKLNYVFIHTDQGLNFPSVDFIRNQVMKISRTQSLVNSKLENIQNLAPKNGGRIKNGDAFPHNLTIVNGGATDAHNLTPITFDIIVLDCSMWTKWDYTSVNTLVSLVDALGKSAKICIFYQLTKPWVELLSTYGLENPITPMDMDQLSRILVDFKQDMTALNLAGTDLNLNLNDAPEQEGGEGGMEMEAAGVVARKTRQRRVRRITTSSLPSILDGGPDNGHYATIATIAQFRRVSFNHIRRKYSIQFED